MTPTPETDATLVERLIWWTNESDCHLISAIYAVNDSQNEDTGPPDWPEWLADQYRSRYGRDGRARLWVAGHLSPAIIEHWPINAFTVQLSNGGRETHAGIVIAIEDLAHVAYLPGIVTDFAVNPPSASITALRAQLEEAERERDEFKASTVYRHSLIGRTEARALAQPEEALHVER